MEPSRLISARTASDEEIARRVVEGEVELFELLMRRHNQRVYRAVRALIRDEHEAEDVMQQAYLAAYQHLKQFEGASRFSTWLIRIALNEALMRLRRASKVVQLDGHRPEESTVPESPPASPEELAAGHELLRVLEGAVDALPEMYRTVFMLRDVEGLTTAECAETLGTSEDVVKTRLHRAKGLLRERLNRLAETHLADSFPFHAPRCDRVVARVMGEILARR